MRKVLNKVLVVLFVWTFLIFSFVEGYSIQKSDIDIKHGMYVSLEKQRPLLEVKLSLLSVKNDNNFLQILNNLEDILIKKLDQNNSEEFKILLYFVQWSIDKFSDNKENQNDINLENMLDDLNFASESKGRWLWFWWNSGDERWLQNVIDDKEKIQEFLNDCGKYEITRVYGSFGNLPVSQKELVAEWNQKLYDKNIDSQLLLGNDFSNILDNESEFLTQIKERFIDFNNNVSSKEKFQSLHFDIEPQAMNEWADFSLLEKKDMLYELLYLYQNIREYLDSYWYKFTDINIDLPHWFSNLHSIGWSDENEMQQWFDDLNKAVDDITLMTYETKNIDTLEKWSENEEKIFWSNLRLALDFDTFENKNEMFDLLEDIEIKLWYQLDIHHYWDLK